MTIALLIIAACAWLEREYLLQWARWRCQRPVLDARRYADFQLALERWKASKPSRQTA